MTAEVAPAKGPEEDGRKGYCYLYIFIAIVVLAGAGAGAGIALSGKEKAPTAPRTRAPTFSPTASPTLLVIELCTGYPDIDVDPSNMDLRTVVRYEELLEMAPKYWPGFSRPVSADDYCAPEHLALIWLTYDDADGALDPQSVEYRLMLSTIYFRTNGNKWTNSTNWLSGLDECSWLGVRCNSVDEIHELDFTGRFASLRPGQDDEGFLITGQLTFPAEVTFIAALSK